MKYSEFERKINSMGFEVIESSHSPSILVANSDGMLVALVSKINEFVVSSFFDEFGLLERYQKKDLVDLCYQLASTPLEDREDEKKYYLRLDSTIIADLSYLNLSEEDGNFELSNKNDFRDYKVTFTETEITELEEKHDLSMFVKEEVE